MFTASELNEFRNTQEMYMQDTCNIITISGYTDTFGDYVKTGVTKSGISCGVEQTNGNEKYGQITIANLDAVIRLPLSTEINSKDQVEITERYGEAVSETYEVIEIRRGPSGLRALTRRITYV